ncbi:MAG: symmetrical bis(5'-nucleosyl)-tetraphosphatase [Gammaproteobacteria bacterium]
MATYAIGDVQGCYDELLLLLKKIKFNPDKDQLWLAGDLVNRGPKSLETLRFARNHADAVVLGNHDLHLLATACNVRAPKQKDTLQPILTAQDSDSLLDWLRTQPLFHHDKSLGYSMLHAGLPPQWDRKQAKNHAKEVENVLLSKTYPDFFSHMYGDTPAQWSDKLKGWDRLRFITNCLTRLRYCNSEGVLALDEKGPPGSQDNGLQPWFNWPHRKSSDMNIVFGHWSTLGAYDSDGVHALDTGCLWGGTLTAMKLGKDGSRYKIKCPGAQRPG